MQKTCSNQSKKWQSRSESEDSYSFRAGSSCYLISPQIWSFYFILALLHLFSHRCSCGPAHDEATCIVQRLEKGQDRYNSSSISASATCAIMGKPPFSICKPGITAACITEVVWSSANWKAYTSFQSLGFQVLHLSILSLVPEFMSHPKKKPHRPDFAFSNFDLGDRLILKNHGIVTTWKCILPANCH